jgi:hypothetical protein
MQNLSFFFSWNFRVRTQSLGPICTKDWLNIQKYGIYHEFHIGFMNVLFGDFFQVLHGHFQMVSMSNRWSKYQWPKKPDRIWCESGSLPSHLCCNFFFFPNWFVWGPEFFQIFPTYMVALNGNQRCLDSIINSL